MKPKIFAVNGKWLCVSKRTCGLGNSPAQAYATWQRFMQEGWDS